MISKRIRQFIDNQDISVYAFENTIGVGRGTIGKALTGNKSIGSDIVENILIKYPKLNAEWLLRGIGNMLSGHVSNIVLHEPINDYGIKKIPVYGNVEVFAGTYLTEGSNAEFVKGYLQLANIKNADGAVYIYGHSMEPLFRDGDLIIVRKAQGKSDLPLRKASLIITTGGTSYVKFLHELDEENFLLTSENSEHAPMTIQKNEIRSIFRIVGKVQRIE